MGKKLPQQTPPGIGGAQEEVSPEAPPRSHDAAILAPILRGSGTCGYQGAQRGGQHAHTGPARAIRPSTLMSAASPMLSGPVPEAQTSILGFLLPVPSSTSEAAPPVRPQARSGHGFRRRSPAGGHHQPPTMVVAMLILLAVGVALYVAKQHLYPKLPPGVKPLPGPIGEHRHPLCLGTARPKRRFSPTPP